MHSQHEKIVDKSEQFIYNEHERRGTFPCTYEWEKRASDDSPK